VIKSITVTSAVQCLWEQGAILCYTPAQWGGRVEDNDSVDHLCVCLRVRQEETRAEPFIGRVTPKLYHIRALMLRLPPPPPPSAVFSLGIYQFLKSSGTEE
jgi:hypothetical protein